MKNDLTQAARSAAHQAHIEAEDAEADARLVGEEMVQMQREVTSREIALPTAAEFSETELLSMPEETKVQHQKALVSLIAKSIKSLHQLGGKLPSELKVLELQTELQQAHAKIAKLQAA